MSVFVYIHVHIIKWPTERRPTDKCVKVSGANGVLDIYWEVAKFTTFEWIIIILSITTWPFWRFVAPPPAPMQPCDRGHRTVITLHVSHYL